MSLHSVHDRYFRTLEPWFIIFFGDLYFLTNFSISNSAAFGETFLCYCCIDCCFTWKISSFLLPPYPVVLGNVQQAVLHFFLLHVVPYFDHTSFLYYISVYSITLALSVFVPQTLIKWIHRIFWLTILVSRHNTRVCFSKNSSSTTPLAYLMLRNLEDAIYEGKLIGDAWWKLRKKRKLLFWKGKETK